jgi:hypothetical protein
LPIGLLAWGWAADAWGIRSVTIGAGAILVAVTAALAVTGRFDGMADADEAATTAPDTPDPRSVVR